MAARVARVPMAALSQHVVGLAALLVPQQPVFFQHTLISDVTALFERSFCTNPSTESRNKNKNPSMIDKGVSPLSLVWHWVVIRFCL